MPVGNCILATGILLGILPCALRLIQACSQTCRIHEEKDILSEKTLGILQ